MRIGITGLSGSLGVALAEHLLKDGGGPIMGISRDEVRAERVMDRFGGLSGDVRCAVVASGLANVEKLEEIFRGCEVLVHAAALKRISQSVYATDEMVDTNVLGTRNILKVATRLGIRRVLVISSDKAVEPTNLYGQTKAVAEQLAVQQNSFSYPAGTRIAVARYGNVLGSRGSVIHLWRQQAEAGKDLTITHPHMTRFLLTLEQAAQFVVACLHMMRGGEIFVPQLPSASMGDLAWAVLAERWGRIPTADEFLARCAYTGLRPGGEKLHEQLLSREEPLRTLRRTVATSTQSCFVICPAYRTWSSEGYSGEPVGDDFTYCSDHSQPRLLPESLLKALSAAPVRHD